jgi:hypothetical protein
MIRVLCKSTFHGQGFRQPAAQAPEPRPLRVPGLDGLQYRELRDHPRALRLRARCAGGLPGQPGAREQAPDRDAAQEPDRAVQAPGIPPGRRSRGNPVEESFTLAAPPIANVVLPQGTRVRTASITDPIVFQLLGDVVIPAGTTLVNVTGILEHSSPQDELFASTGLPNQAIDRCVGRREGEGRRHLPHVRSGTVRPAGRWQLAQGIFSCRRKLQVLGGPGS